MLQTLINELKMVTGQVSDAPKATEYRRDIDGLRAVAVLSVVAYHLRESFLPGGFLGVDIFFVISGYLITQIIYREIAAKTFTLKAFYERRIRRIAPALLLVMIVTAAAAVAILLPGDLVGFAKSVFATLAFSANIYFWRDSDYFSRVAGEKPLLHLWSLGVEEQFYILFPLFLIACRALNKNWTVALTLAGLLASFALDILLQRIGGASPAFYLLPTRAWELAAGAVLAIANPGPASRLISQWLGWLGLALIAASLAHVDALFSLGLPAGTFAVIGAVCVIYAGATPGTPVARLLGLAPLVGVGLISYSLYLWHWPVLVLLKYRTLNEPGPLLLVAAVVVMFVGAYLSWRYVERPFRSRSMGIKKVVGVVAAATALVVIPAGAFIALGGLPERLTRQTAQINEAVGSHFRCQIQDYVVVGQSRGCALNLPSRRIDDADVALIGNSHALMYAPVLADELKGRGLHGVLLNANSCLPSTKVNLEAACFEQAGAYIDAVSAARAKIVFIGLRWELDPAARLVDANGQSHEQVEGTILAMEDTIDRLKAAGKTVVLIGPIAQPGWDVASIVSRSMAFGMPVNRPLSVEAAAFEQKMGPVLKAFAGRSDIVFLRADQILCDANGCHFLQGDRAMFADDHHLSADALALYRKPFTDALDAALAREAARSR